MHQGVIILKKADKDVPKEYLDEVLKWNKTAIGAVAAEKGEILISSTVAASEQNLRDNVKEASEQLKGLPVLFWIGNSPNGTMLDEDLQPFVLLRNAKDKPVVVGILEGNFSSFEETNSSHSNEYHAVQDMLIPKFQKMFKECGFKVDQFMGTIGTDKLIRRELATMFMNRGVITLLASTGEIQTVSKNDLHKEFSWGWVSNAYEYEEKAVKEEPKAAAPTPERKDVTDDTYKAARIKAAKLQAEADQAKSSAQEAKLAKIKAAREAAEKAAREVEELEKEATEEAAATASVDIPKTDTALPKQEDNYEIVMMSPPADCRSNNQVKKWYRKNYKSVPNNWEDRPQVPIRRKKGAILKSFQDLKDAEVKDTAPKHIPEAAGTPTREQDDESIHAKGEQEADVSDETLPVVGPKEKAHVLDVFLKRQSIDQNSKEIIDPADIPEIESRYPTFSEVYGLPGIEVAYRWSYEDFFALTEDRKSAALLLMNLASKCVELEKAKPKKAQAETPPSEKKLDLRRRAM